MSINISFGSKDFITNSGLDTPVYLNNNNTSSHNSGLDTPVYLNNNNTSSHNSNLDTLGDFTKSTSKYFPNLNIHKKEFNKLAIQIASQALYDFYKYRTSSSLITTVINDSISMPLHDRCLSNFEMILSIFNISDLSVLLQKVLENHSSKETGPFYILLNAIEYMDYLHNELKTKSKSFPIDIETNYDTKTPVKDFGLSTTIDKLYLLTSDINLNITKINKDINKNIDLLDKKLSNNRHDSYVQLRRMTSTLENIEFSTSCTRAMLILMSIYLFVSR